MSVDNSIYRRGAIGLSQRLLLSWKFYGASGIVAGLLASLLKQTTGPNELQKGCQRYKERCFDNRFEVSTSEEVPIDQLGVDPDKERSAVEYSPTSPVWFSHLLSGLNVNYQEFTFLDLGSGKGRTLLLASEFPFKDVIGVEISERLHVIAETNLSTYRSKSQRCQDIQSIRADATTYDFPESPLVVFLYNPFHIEVITPVFENLQNSWLKKVRPIIIVYSNPLYRQLFDEAHWLEEVASGGATWVVYQSSTVINN